MINKVSAKQIEFFNSNIWGVFRLLCNTFFTVTTDDEATFTASIFPEIFSVRESNIAVSCASVQNEPGSSPSTIGHYEAEFNEGAASAKGKRRYKLFLTKITILLSEIQIGFRYSLK